MNRISTLLLAAAAALAMIGSAQADTVVYNSTPNDGWLYGTGNGYLPANTAVETTDAGDQLYLRMHNTFLPANPAADDVYNFALGNQQISFDWGFDSLSAFTGTAIITLSNLAGGSYSYNALAPGNDNKVMSGSTQNSGRLNWFSVPLNFDPTVNSTYKVNLTVNGLEGGEKSLDVYAKVGEGFSGAVPEPATWALMIAGFGLTGVMLRTARRQTAVA